MRASRLLGAAISCAIVLNPLQSFADDKYWVCGSDSWDQSSCWNPAGLPTTGDNVFLTQSDNTDRVVTYANAISPAPVLHQLIVDATGSGTMTLSQSKDAIEFSLTGTEYIGYNGTGIFNQTGGINGDSTGLPNLYLIVGYNSTANGTYNLFDGTVRASSAFIGAYGTGTFNQGGGVLYPDNNLSIGNKGTYNLSDGLIRSGESELNVHGTFNQTGGIVRLGITGMYISGEYNLSDGELTKSVGLESISGTFNQSGGIHRNIIGSPVSISGTYNLTGGIYQTDRLTINSGGTFNFDGGTLSVGNFTGDLVNNGGTLAPGSSPGTTNITGNYSQSIDSVYAAELGGTAPGEFDVLDVAGVATLNGRLDVTLFDLGGGEFNPSLGDSFDILLAETISGEFDYYMLPTLDEGLRWDVSYLADEIDSTDIVRLSVEAVPIPPSVWLFGSGLLGLIGIARRKKAA